MLFINYKITKFLKLLKYIVFKVPIMYMYFAVALLIVLLIFYISGTFSLSVVAAAPATEHFDPTLLDSYGGAIAQVVRDNGHYDMFKKLVKVFSSEPPIDPTTFDTLYWFQKNNWLSKQNLLKILSKDTVGLAKNVPNTYN